MSGALLDLLAEEHTRRGDAPQQAALLSDIAPEARVPQAHPLRRRRVMVEAVLTGLSPQSDRRSSHTGRPSMAPEQWRRAVRLQVLSPSRSARRLMAQLDGNLRLRWLVGLTREDPVWDPAPLSKHRDRWLAGDVAHRFLDQVLAQARGQDRLWDAPCTVDGPWMEAWAGQQSCKRKATGTPGPPPDDPGPPRRDCRGARRTTAPPAATTEPAARLDKQATGQEATLASLGPVRRDNRHGLVVDTRLTQATGTAEREAAVARAAASPGQQRVTVGADTNDETRDGGRERREWRVPPQVARPTSGRASAIDGRTPRHAG